MKTCCHHWAIAIIAWIVFVISFFLPAFDQMPGWKAAILQGFFWPQAIQGDLLAVHYQLLTFANVLMFMSPFFLGWGKCDPRFVKGLRALSIAATVLVWLFLARLFGNHNGPDLKIGCYFWAASFILLCLAAFLQPIPSNTNTPKVA